MLNVAFLNLALQAWEQGDYNRSVDYLDNQLLTRGFNRDILFYLKALNLLFQKKLNQLEKYIVNELDLEKNSFIKEFKQEFYLLLAFISTENKNKEQANFYIKKLLNEDPFLYQEYNYSPYIIKTTVLNWSYLYSYCQEISNFNSNYSLSKALLGFCQIKTNNFTLADNSIKQAKNIDPENPLFLALSSYLLMSKNKDSTQSEQIFSLINYEKTRDTLPFFLKAHFLEEKGEWGNALIVWEKLLSLEPNNLSGVAGVAFNNYQLGKTSVANIYTKKALEEYPHYVKLLPYKKELF